MVKAALQLAKITSVDPFGGLPETNELGKLDGDLKLYDAAIADMTTEWKIDQAMRAEKAAFDFDPRIQLSEGILVRFPHRCRRIPPTPAASWAATEPPAAA